MKGIVTRQLQIQIQKWSVQEITRSQAHPKTAFLHEEMGIKSHNLSEAQ